MEQSNRLGTIFIIILLVVALCIGFAYLGYSFNQYQATIDGNSYNFNLGREAGEKIGHDKGFREGYAAGLKLATDNKSSFDLHDPTYQEMKDFLASDTSNDKSYVQDSHICTDFTTDVNNNAEKSGIRCAGVYIIYPETGHSIVAFNTTDRGLIFVEPQFDREVKLVEGRSYAASNGFIKQADLNDTILRYLVMW